MLSFFPIEN
jgi:hypothetical protein